MYTKNKIIAKIIFVMLISLLLLSSGKSTSQASLVENNCRFGVGVPRAFDENDLSILKVGGYINWGFKNNYSLSGKTDYIRMFRVSDYQNRYSIALENVESIVTNNPGSYIIIGNEPDTLYENQDGVEPELYAERYYELATKIRKYDPSAKIGFGTIVQPSPIRIRYLDRAWEKLVSLAGDRLSASRLIDFWTIHSFILNEFPDEWGVGIPPGFEFDYSDAVHISDLQDTHSIDIFIERIRNFRAWMVENGERNKPLWISEYGSLLPSIDPPTGPNLSNVSDEDTAKFMIDTFDYLLNGQDTEIGLPFDQYRLVQRWFWYSLNDLRCKFGGSLYDTDTGKLTTVGKAFVDYKPKDIIGPDYFFLGVIVNPINQISDDKPADYRIDFLLSNAGSSDGNNITVEIFQGEPEGELLAKTQKTIIPGCGQGVHIVSAWLDDLIPISTSWLSARVDTTGDLNPTNNVTWFYINKP